MEHNVLYNVCIHLPLDSLMSFRNDNSAKRVVMDKSFWKAKLEHEKGLVLPHANIEWYIVYHSMQIKSFAEFTIFYTHRTRTMLGLCYI